MSGTTLPMAWTCVNMSGKTLTVHGFSIAIDRAEYGYYARATYTLMLDGEVVASAPPLAEASELNAAATHALEIPVSPGGTLRLEAAVTFFRPLESFEGRNAGWEVTAETEVGQGRLSLHYDAPAPEPPAPPSGGGGNGLPSGLQAPGVPPALEGANYVLNSGLGVWARVTRWSYPPSFGVKELVPPPAPAALYYPTVAGPNYEGRVSGLLLTPAVVTGVQHEDGRVEDLEGAGVRFTLGTGDISTSAAIGIHPFKDSGEV
ncbi:hypothetical protein Dcar01_02401 [Deinococcus carri]|uniref:Uncharacterized protein n=1 Tax=Deinococcus carri TaxID=1211323 RepID=A0ABP9W8I0_9DEIO